MKHSVRKMAEFDLGMVVSGTSKAASGPLRGRVVTLMQKPLCRTNTTRQIKNKTELHL
jgi:hypothetical protein